MDNSYKEAMESLVFKDQDHHRYMTGEDKDICFCVTTLSSKIGIRIPIILNNFEKAKKIVINNESDIFECSYGLVVIEGFYINTMYGSIYEEQYWYAWSQEESKYKAIERPAIYNNIVGFGMG